MATVVLPDTTGHDDRPVVELTTDASADQPRSIRGLNLDGVASALGSVLGSLGLVWVLFEQVLGWSGYPAFLLCWFATFLGLYAAVSARGNPRPVVVSRLAGAVVGIAAAVVGFALGSTVVYVFYKGWSAIRHVNFYTHDMAGVRPTSPLTEGGALHAMVGTLVQVSIAVVIALGFFTSARIAEQVKAGIQALPRGQRYAGLAVGLTLPQTYRYVILPMAFRIVIPPLTSESMNIVKNSSVAFAVNRVAAFIEKRVQVPGMIGSTK